MINVEEDCATCNSFVVLCSKQSENFLYVDRHGNWVVGSKVGHPVLP